jgi:hypothetical protein
MTLSEAMVPDHLEYLGRALPIHRDTVKHLPTGTAAVTSPGHTEPAIRPHAPPEDAR